MTTRLERLRHARQPSLYDYYSFQDYAMCGERVGGRDSLPYGDFRKLAELQNAGQFDPALTPL